MDRAPLVALLALSACAANAAPAPPRTDAKLMVHADDLGSWHAVNAAIFRGLEDGTITSASAMVPCPWFPEVAAWAAAHPGADIGLHLTLTSERPDYRWGPVASRDKVPSLLDENGYLHRQPIAERLNPDEVAIEIRAQVRHARALGLVPTHLDAHHGLLYSHRALFAVL